MKKNLIEIVLLLDRSGSMGSLKQEAVSGFNAFLKQQKEQFKDYEVNFSLILFNSEFKELIDRESLFNVKQITQEDYQPNGFTSLLDAIGITTDQLGKKLKETPESQRPSKVIIGIITDGQQNSSKVYTQEQIKKMIKHQEQKYNWHYSFLSSDIKSIENAKHNYGIFDTTLYSANDKGYIGVNSSYSSLSRGIKTAVVNDSKDV